ncbi:MAG TPA: hypothetical protein VGR56_05030, partial [Nitrososphaerales archaeon]|nr:hypothetical protein [Nitrososphaerales archaeon]
MNDSGAYVAASSFMYNNTYQEPAVLKVGSVYNMWFNGYLNGIFGLYKATSANGVDWKVGSSIVLPSGAKGSWDSNGPYGPSVIWNGTRYLMYFGGNNNSANTRSIGVAVSKDGIQWTQYANNPILKPGPARYDGGYIRDPNVVFHNGSYTMWYKGRSTFGNGSLVVGIDVATSPDGLHWTKYSGNPVLGYVNDSSFAKDLIFQKPSVVQVGGGYFMAADDGTRVGYATSVDGLHWRMGDGWLVQPTNDTSWSGYQVVYPSLLVNGTTLLLWYFGTSALTSPISPYKSGIGLASCALVIFQSSVTTTSTATVTTTNVLTSTTTVVSEKTTQITLTTALSTGVPVYDISTVALGGLLAV